MKRKKVSFSINEKHYPGMVINLVSQTLQSFVAQYGVDVAKINEFLALQSGTKASEAIEELILNAETSLKELESLCRLVTDIKEPEAKKKTSSPE